MPCVVWPPNDRSRASEEQGIIVDILCGINSRAPSRTPEALVVFDDTD